MKPNRTDLQQVIELLIQRLEMQTFSSRFVQKTSSFDENVITSGRITVKYCIRVRGNISVRCFDFLILLNGEAIYRGIIGHIPILYTKQNQELREKLLNNESIDGIITIRHTKYSFSKIAVI